MSQCSLILKDLKSGKSITPVSALNLYGSFRLGARIYDLKMKGYNIINTSVVVGKKRFASYSMEDR